ncbi:MerR family transcriptional regulator [Paenibacillus ehimensis]|uniref:MerR family transcriptional regulator n=1 Tax=Paenibacillus ehimensis TaxID=79264 RepID=A0ABT8V933_9BACL|nr:MerR family transcriptional regulator [Paenibacillus ehimensis]MDO3677027.1 MerR family transcriptional regulator [Paenibacillus ehimensis]MEC0209386.1 MerR family transcriptional regulator [Paenibacillus ehimensis]
MKIGELSKATGASIRSIRYYEKQGLITPARTESGYREYHKFAVEQVNTIRLYLKLGLSTEQIAGFLQCVLMNKEAFCNEVLPVYRQKLKEIDEQIQTLVRIRSNLEDRIQSILSEQTDNESMEGTNDEH